MKRQKPNLRKFLDQSFAGFRKLPPEHVETACERVLDRLRGTPESASEFDTVSASAARSGWSVPRFAFVVLAVIVLLSIPFVRRFVSPQNVYAIVVTVSGSVDRVADGESRAVSAGEKIDSGKTLRTNGESGLVFDLPDGSRVEMNSNSEVVLERETDGTLLQLNAGSVIVTSAKQRSGRLYVRTKNSTVSVVDAVFFVSAENAGSRVVVIRGEAEVQDAKSSQKLSSGEQLATNPLLELHPVREEIAWSRSASALLALLQQSNPTRTAASGPLQFEVVSIRTPPSGAPRFACRGIDGAFEPLGVGPSAFGNVGFRDQILEGPLSVPNGRCVGNNDLFHLVSIAYGIPIYGISGGPGWARAMPGAGLGPIARFSIEAKAEDASNVTKAQLRQMLQSMLADRFSLKIHWEPKEVDGYALLVAKSGPRLKEASGDIELPHPGGYDSARPISEIVIKGKSPLKDLADYLMPFASYGQTASPVVEKTGLTAMYEYTLTLHQSLQGGAPRGGGGGDIGGGYDPPISKALEQQLGLTLQPQKIQSQSIVIDQAEKPSEN